MTKNIDETETSISNLPELEESVVVQVTGITRYGVYLQLIDYQCTGFLPISEISSRWVKRITDVVRYGEKLVVKILRINEERNTVDVSLKDLTVSERRKVMREWKLSNRGFQLLSEYSIKSGVEFDKLELKLDKYIEKYGNIFVVLERIITDPELFESVSLSIKIKNELKDFLSKRIEPTQYGFEALVKIIFYGKGGIYKLKDALEKFETTSNKHGLTAKITSAGAPIYMVRLFSYKPELIKKYAEKILNDELNNIQKMGAQVSITKKGEKIKV